MARQKIHFDDPADDRLLAVVLTLASEVWLLRERFAVHEAIAARRGVALENEVENYEFAPADQERMDRLRKEFVGNLFRMLDEHGAPGAGRKRAGRKPMRAGRAKAARGARRRSMRRARGAP